MPFLKSAVEICGMGSRPVWVGRPSARRGPAADALRRRSGSLGASVRRSHPSVGDQHGVLDADTAEIGEVHPGLDGHHVTGDEGSSRAGRHPRLLVDVEADPVAGGVQERVAPAGVVDHRAAGRVDLRGRRPRPPPPPPRRRWDGQHDLEHAHGGRRPTSPTATVRVMSEW